MLDWKGDAETLDRLYWSCEAGRHQKQTPPQPKYSWQELITAWRKDLRIQNKLASSTRVQYHRVMDDIIQKNGNKDVRNTSRQALRTAHEKLADTPRKADRYIQTVKMLLDYAAHKLDWPLGPNPASGIDLFGKQREYEPWPDWMVSNLETAPQTLRIAAELILGTGQRPSAAIAMRRDQFAGEWRIVCDEKGDKTFEVYCPESLRKFLSTLPLQGAHILSKNLTEPLGYSAVDKTFRAWRSTLPDTAKKYVLHGMRKLAIIRLAEAGCSDAEIQSVTGQSIEMVAYYRQMANRKVLSKSAMERNRNKT